MFEYNKKGNWYQHNKNKVGDKTLKKLEEVKKKLDLAEKSADMDLLDDAKEFTENCEFSEEINKELKKDFIRIGRAIDRSVSWEFAYFLRYYRRLRGLSLKELEEKTGITASYINRLERGYKKSPSLGLVEKLAEALNVPVYVLLGGTEEDMEIKDISEIVYNERVTFLGEKLNTEQKVLLVEIIKFILDEENWRNSYTAGIELMDLVDKLHKNHAN